MTGYKPIVHDVVFVNREDMNENIKELGLEVNKEYLVSYVFADGGCILYEEEVHSSGYIDVSEYILESEDVECLSFISNYMDDAKKKYGFNDISDLVYLNEDELNTITYDTWVDHDLEIGDYVYFDDVEVIKFFYEAELENGVPYEVVKFCEHNNAPFIMTNIGELQLEPLEVLYLNLYKGKVKEENRLNKKMEGITMSKERKTELTTQKDRDAIDKMLNTLVYENAMDKALEEGDYEQAKLISESNKNALIKAEQSEK